MNIIVDTKYRIDDITKAKPEKIQENVYEEINKYVLNRLPYPDITEENYNPEIVVEHLSKLRKLIEEKSKQVANIFSYYEWLYHIRRMPSVFFKDDWEQHIVMILLLLTTWLHFLQIKTRFLSL